MTQPTLYSTIRPGDVLIVRPVGSPRHHVERVEKMSRLTFVLRRLCAGGRVWGTPTARQLLAESHVAANLGPLSPRVDLELLYKTIERIDADYAHDVASAERTRQRYLDTLARGFTGDQT